MAEIRLTPVTDTAPAAWLEDSVRIRERVAVGFAAYARILHPATDAATDAQLSWASVAQTLGMTDRDELVSAFYGDDSDDWRAPDQGNLVQPQLDTLLGILTRHTSTPDLCFAALVEWKYLPFGGSGRKAAALKPPQLSPQVRKQATFDLPNHLPYLLLQGAVVDTARVGGYIHPHLLNSHSPNLLWPDDHAWFVCTDIDDYETYVSGSRQLIDEIATHPLFEVEEISADHRDSA
ncbi:hypothetical protein [Nocardia sp. NPDC051570]|uniref:hypothetical protein n=1 Tax=Nocardia sp. NPDC051570 TaxID=3364324 RepID=UPI00379CEB05